MNSTADSAAAGGDPNRLGSARRSLASALTPDELRIGALLYPERFARPTKRGDCANIGRPCPYVGCRHHLYLEVSAGGGTRASTDLEPWEMTSSCSLDVADLGEHSLEQLAVHLGITRQRAQQIESRARVRFQRAVRRGGFDV